MTTVQIWLNYINKIYKYIKYCRGWRKYRNMQMSNIKNRIVHLLVLPKFLIVLKHGISQKCKPLLNCTQSFVTNFNENLFQTKAKSRSGSCRPPVCCSVIRSVLSGLGRPPWRQRSPVHCCTAVVHIYILTYVVILIRHVHILKTQLPVQQLLQIFPMEGKEAEARSW